jgi:hypothetical protein
MLNTEYYVKCVLNECMMCAEFICGMCWYLKACLLFQRLSIVT